MKINMVMIVRNEERCLRRSLEAAASFVDDMIIVDTGSADQTKAIARSFGETSGKRVLLYDFAWTRDFSAARNFSLEKSETDGGADYSLVIDADERIRTTKLSSRENLEKFIQEAEAKRETATLKEAEAKRETAALKEPEAQEEPGTEKAAGVREKSEAQVPAETQREIDASGTDRWCGDIRRIDEVKGKKGEVYTCLTLIPRLLPRGVRYHGIICEMPDTESPGALTPLLVDHDGYDRNAQGEKSLPYLARAMAAEPDEPYWKFQMAAALLRLRRLQDSLPYFQEFYRMILQRYPDVTDTSEYREPYARRGILAYLNTLEEMHGEKYMQKALHILLRQEPHMHRSADYYFFCGDFFMELVQMNTQRYITYLPRVEQSFIHCLQIGENTEDSVIIGNGSFRAFYHLGVWYELTNQPEHAKSCYESAAQMGYEPAMRRIELYKR